MAGRQTSRYRTLQTWFLLLALLVTAGCGRGVTTASFAPTEATLKHRVLTTRQFDGVSETDLLSASTGVLQDLGFSIEEIENRLGLVTGIKETEAEVPGFTWFVNLPGFKRAEGPKEFRASVVVHPGRDTGDRTQFVRVTFHVKIWATDVLDDGKEKLFIQESVDDTEIYTEFFELLSKSVFLEGQDI